MDPNLGVPTDAIQVWCNVTSKGETCVYPDFKSRMVTDSLLLEGYVYLINIVIYNIVMQNCTAMTIINVLVYILENCSILAERKK